MRKWPFCKVKGLWWEAEMSGETKKGDTCVLPLLLQIYIKIVIYKPVVIKNQK